MLASAFTLSLGKVILNYLGIVINNRLTWQDHVDKMFSKIKKKLGLLKRILYCLPLDARLLFLTAMFCHSLTMQISYGG